MSLEEGDEPRFVVTSNRLIHEPSCAFVRHQVNEESYPVQVSPELAVIGSLTDGSVLYRESPRVGEAVFTADYATAAQIAQLPYSLRRCQVCCPNTVDHRVEAKLPGTLKASSVTRRHLGKTFVDVGVLHAIVHTAEHISVVGSRGGVDVAPSDPVRYEVAGTPIQR